MSHQLRAAIAATTLILSGSCPAWAGILIYEGYNGYASGDIVGQNPSSATIGLDKTTPYARTGSSNTPPTLAYTRATGLTFGALDVAGDAVSASNGSVRLLNANVDLADYTGSQSYTGTLYGSYLINIANLGGAGTTTLEVRMTGTGGGSRFVSAADSPGDANHNSGVGYNNTATTTGPVLNTNQTYIVLSEFTHVGETLNNTTTIGQATQWILTAAQFANFKPGGLTASELNGASVGTGNSNVFSRSTTTLTDGTTNSLVDGSTLQLVINGDATARTATFDELRYGSSLDDVTPVPEPVLLTWLAAGAVLMRRRVRRQVAD